MNKSTMSYKSFITISTDDKKSRSKEKIQNDFNIISTNFKQNLNNSLFNLKEATKKKSEKRINKEEYEKTDFIIKDIENLFNKYINDMKDFYNHQYENILRFYEQKIRILHENIFNLELKKRILEESNYNLLKKEKEYDLIRSKTGIIVQNGKIINNNIKENEILILKKENSILKDTIERQRLDIIKGKTIQQNNIQINKKIISKLNSKNNKNKNISVHHSHPKSNPHYNPSKSINSILKYNSFFSKKCMKSNSYSKNFTSKNSIFQRSSKKNKVKIKPIKGTKKIFKKHRSFNKDYIPDISKRNNLDNNNGKENNNLLIKTMNNENNSNRRKKIYRFLSPKNAQIKHINSLIPKVKTNLNEIRPSDSFTLRNNNSNVQNNKLDSEKMQTKNIKKIMISKIENNLIKKGNLLINKRKNLSNSKSNVRSNCKIYKSNHNSKGKNNNINIINYTSINNYIKKQKIYRNNK